VYVCCGNLVAIFRVQALNLPGLKQGFMAIVIVIPLFSLITLGVGMFSLCRKIKKDRKKEMKASSPLA
jgi:uncharacterized membrane protein